MERFETEQDAYAHMLDNVSYVTESLFFNPRREGTKYLIEIFDYLMVRLEEGGVGWVLALDFNPEVIGMEFKEVLAKFDTVLSIAVPKTYTFSENGFHALNAYFNWKALGMGFGQLSMYWDPESKVLEFNTEGMSKETTRHLLHQWVDHLVGIGKFDSD